MDDLLSDFLSETSDHIDGIATYLVSFEQNPSDADAVTQIFRLMHTIKGTAGFLGLSGLQEIAHAAETLIDTLRNGAAPTAVAVSLLLESFDRIKHLVARVAELGEEPEADHSDIISRIHAYLASGAGEEASLPLAAEPDCGCEETAPAPIADPQEQSPAETAGAICGPSETQQASDGGPRQNSRSVKEIEPSAPKEKAPDTIRLSVATIQRIMDLVSELVLTRNQIMDLSRQHNIGHIKSPLERLSTVTSDLQDAVMRARMQPMTRLFASVPRMIRDLSAGLEKKFDLVIEGADTELDRQIIEAIRDPLTHLVRNCAGHGIESPYERLATGKPEAGRITISAFYDSGQVHIEVSDDGRGLDADRIREKALERGLASEAALAAMSDEEVYRFIMEPGFSTAQTVTTVSGRGVGMDVVRANIEGVGGAISLQSMKGCGSKFILKIPLTLAIAPALIVKASGQRFAIPQQYVVEAVDGDARNLKTMDNSQILQLRDEVIPVVALSKALELEETGRQEDKLVVVLGLRGQKLGVIVDEIDDIQEIVVKPLGPLFSSLKMFSGNTILGDGAVILIIDPAGVAAAMNIQKTSNILPSLDEQAPNAAAPSSLILFKAGAGAPKVLPRSAVSRIIRVPSQEMREADGLRLYRYQGQLIPVLRVAEAEEHTQACLILVVTLYDRTFGLWVDNVLDIVESQAEIQLISSSPALLGTAELRGSAVEFIDVGYYYRTAFQEARQPAAAKAELLIVDSEPGMHDLLTPLLASAGHKVTAVDTAEQANKLLHQKTFGAILLDAKSARSIDKAALSRQTDALCLIFNDDRRQGAGEDAINKFDRHQLLTAINRHLDKLPCGGPQAANLNLPSLDFNASARSR